MADRLHITAAALDSACAVRPDGFRAAFCAVAEPAADGAWTIDREGWKALVAAHLGQGQRALEPPEPTVAELASNFSAALARWASSGFAVVTREQHAERMSACSSCEHWRPRERLGLGVCRAPGCGCTRLKHWLATERCPLGLWPKI